MVTNETLRAEALERRTAERRAAHTRAAVAYCQSVDRRKADAALVAQWIRRFEAARIEGGRA